MNLKFDSSGFVELFFDRKFWDFNFVLVFKNLFLKIELVVLWFELLDCFFCFFVENLDNYVFV